MSPKEMWALIYDVVLFEANQSAEDEIYVRHDPEWDVDRTTEKVFEHLVADGTYDLMKHWEQWKYEEGVHLAALDYFSSYEPVFVGMEKHNA